MNWGWRVVCLVVLLAFLLMCGVHLAGAHHDGEAHGLAVAAIFGLLVFVFTARRCSDIAFPACRPIFNFDMPARLLPRDLIATRGQPLRL